MPERTLVIIAGPNGAGKTTFYFERLAQAFPLFVNADEIAKTVSGPDVNTRNLEAAQMAEQQRSSLIAAGETFAMETVFSRPEHWLAFIAKAKAAGFSVLLFFLCLESAELHIGRVAQRVELGGHDVPADKIVQRREGALNTAVLALSLVDELWLYDNSVLNQTHRLVGHFAAGSEVYRADRLPAWAQRFFA